jgi:hypothetical protein
MSFFEKIRTWYSGTNKTAAATIAILFLLAITTTTAWASIKPFAEKILQSDQTRIYAAIYCTVAVAVKCIFDQEKTWLHRFGEFLFGSTGYSAASTSSLNLIGAAYLQFFSSGEAFKNLGILDVASIVLSSSVLLIYSAVVCTQMMLDALSRSNAASIKATTQTNIDPAT